MSTALRMRRARRGTVLLAGAALIAGASSLVPAGPANADQTADANSRGTVGTLPSSPSLGVLPNIDANNGDEVIAIAGPKGLTDESKLRADSGQLWFSRLDDRPTRLDKLAGVPTWGQPHWGTDASGKAVAVYPRCTGGKVSDCDLYAWDVEANTERKLTEVDADGVGELEGTMQHGAIAWTRSLPADAGASVAKSAPLGRVLHFRSAAGIHIILRRNGGTDLALRSGVVAQNRVLHPDAEDGERQVELVRRGGKTTSLYRYADAAAPRWAVGLHFFGNELRFGIASQDHASLVRVPLANPKKRRVVDTSFTFTSLAFARRDLLVWIGDSSSESSSPLIDDFIPKRFA